MTLDSALEWIDEGELVEVTPKSVRIRNRVLKTGLRAKHRLGSVETADGTLSDAD
jgi:predicted membrane GTPase involved in stress response